MGSNDRGNANPDSRSNSRKPKPDNRWLNEYNCYGTDDSSSRGDGSLNSGGCDDNAHASFSNALCASCAGAYRSDDIASRRVADVAFSSPDDVAYAHVDCGVDFGCGSPVFHLFANAR